MMYCGDGSIVDHILARRTELLVPFNHLINSLDQIFLSYGFASVPNREHPGLSAHRSQLGTCGVRTQTA